MKKGRSHIDPMQRFWKFVFKHDRGCWEWIGARFYYGYGCFQAKSGKSVRTHRFIWERLFGEIPQGMVVCHKCDNPPCVNPDHLYIGTQSQNMKDAYSRKRHSVKGSKHPSAILDEGKVIQIREKYNSGKHINEIMNEYSVSRSTIYSVVLPKSKHQHWKHVQKTL